MYDRNELRGADLSAVLPPAVVVNFDEPGYYESLLPTDRYSEELIEPPLIGRNLPPTCHTRQLYVDSKASTISHQGKELEIGTPEERVVFNCFIRMLGQGWFHRRDVGDVMSANNVDHRRFRIVATHLGDLVQSTFDFPLFSDNGRRTKARAYMTNPYIVPVSLAARPNPNRQLSLVEPAIPIDDSESDVSDDSNPTEHTDLDEPEVQDEEERSRLRADRIERSRQQRAQPQRISKQIVRRVSAVNRTPIVQLGPISKTAMPSMRHDSEPLALPSGPTSREVAQERHQRESQRLAEARVAEDQAVLDAFLSGSLDNNISTIKQIQTESTAARQSHASSGDDDTLGWKKLSNCLGVDPDLFFPERGASTKEAKAVCQACVVRDDCAEFALANGEKFGIWGGLSERERRRIRRQRKLSNGRP